MGQGRRCQWAGALLLQLRTGALLLQLRAGALLLQLRTGAPLGMPLPHRRWEMPRAPPLQLRSRHTE